MKYKIAVISAFLVFFIILGFFAYQGMMPYRYTQIKQEVLVYQEAIKLGGKTIVSLYFVNQAKQLVDKTEHKKALALADKIDLYYDKATILTLLANHWEKPNLSGANAAVMHRIVAEYNK